MSRRGFERRQLGVHVGEHGGDGGLFGDGREVEAAESSVDVALDVTRRRLALIAFCKLLACVSSE